MLLIDLCKYRQELNQAKQDVHNYQDCFYELDILTKELEAFEDELSFGIGSIESSELLDWPILRCLNGGRARHLSPFIGPERIQGEMTSRN